MTDREHDIALREAHQITAEDEYFEARSSTDSENGRRLFAAGFSRGWQARGAQQEPVGYIGADTFTALSGGETVCPTLTPSRHMETDVALFASPPAPVEPTAEMVTVPRKPTEAMLQAGALAIIEMQEVHGCSYADDAGTAYKAMIAAKERGV